MAWVGSRNAARHPPWPAARRWSKVEGLQKVVKFDFSLIFRSDFAAHRSHAHTPTASSQRRLRKCSVMSSTLDDMTYRQLQALAKQHKIAANQKKVVLIEKLGAVMTAKAQPATATTAKAQPAAATAAQKENSGPDNAVTDEVWKWVKDEASAIKAAKDGAMRALEVSERLASAESKIINFFRLGHGRFGGQARLQSNRTREHTHPVRVWGRTRMKLSATRSSSAPNPRPWRARKRAMLRRKT